ncbi:MAG: hypothetical protein M1396_07030, partial [Chloroflexi bacterium]|nr:hypothetical protein [Chloroflexota bacterium]
MSVTLSGAESPVIDALMERLSSEDFLGQLLRREGHARVLALEGDDVKLDWVDGVEQLLTHPEWLRMLAGEAIGIRTRGIRRVIWSGMGGSIQTIYTLERMGFVSDATFSIHPLDSTDPASLNRILREIARCEGIEGLDERTIHPDELRRLLGVTAMIGVSMGMTSEEPITHLTWFDGLLHEVDLPQPSDHIEVMTLPGSYLDEFAAHRQARRLSIQVDGQNHTAGRMSAPATRVFLHPIALYLAASGAAAEDVAAGLQTLLQACQTQYRVSHTLSTAERASINQSHPFLRLGAYMAHETMQRRRNKTVLCLPPAWRGLAPWVEQLVEESLGKEGKGWLIFYDQDIHALAGRDDFVVLDFAPDGKSALEASVRRLVEEHAIPVLQLSFPVETAPATPRGLAALTAMFANWKLAVWAFGYLRDIVVAGQPAVEAYKAYARALRDDARPVPFDLGPGEDLQPVVNIEALRDSGVWTVVEDERIRESPGKDVSQAVARLALVISRARAMNIRYLDLTYNGEVTPAVRAVLEDVQCKVGFAFLGIPTKLRSGPSDYHSTEQSETDGPPELLSIRIITLTHEQPLAGTYSDRFLLAQARGTWQAMRDARRHVVMVTLPSHESAAADLAE